MIDFTNELVRVSVTMLIMLIMLSLFNNELIYVCSIN